MGKADDVTTDKPDGEPTTDEDKKGEPTGDGPAESTAADDSTPKLPIQLAAMLGDIKSHLQTFTKAPPHTLQRLAELVLHPHAHYRALATYLHAVDRVVQVTSGSSTYPLPEAIPDMSSMHINGVDGSHDHAAASVSWGNPTTGANTSSASAAAAAAAAVGSDEALGGALLTPIPWLTRRSSPENGDAASTSSAGGSTGGGSAGSAGAQIHSEGTETIDGPNGMGSIETVSVSVNGVPSTGHARGVTQGELLRQEQRAGVVPVSQLSRNAGHQQQQQHAMHQQQQQQQSQHDGGEGSEDEDGNEGESRSADKDDGAPSASGNGEGSDENEDEEIPHARGPDEIGVNDTGPQTATTSSMGEGGLEMQGIDLAAAVGRPPEEEEHLDQQQQQPKRATPPPADGEDKQKKEGEEEEVTDATSPESTGTKREAEESAEGEEPVKKVKEE